MLRRKVIVAVDIGPWDRVMYTAATIASALNSFQYPGLCTTGHVVLYLPKQVPLNANNKAIEYFAKAVSDLADLQLYKVSGEDCSEAYLHNPNEGVLKHVAADVEVDGLLQVKPGIIVTPELVEAAANAKVISTIAGKYVTSPLYPADTYQVAFPRSSAVVRVDGEVEPALTSYCGRAVILDPNLVYLSDLDADIDEVSPRDTTGHSEPFLSTVSYFQRKGLVSSGFTGAVDVPVGDIVKSLTRGRDMRYPGVFPYEDWWAADTPEASYRFIMAWIREAMPKEVFGTAQQGELFQILRVFYPFAVV